MSIYDHNDFTRRIIEDLNKSMLEAADPLVEEALFKIGQRMRKQMGAELIGMMENHMSISMERDELVIRIIRPEDMRK